MTVLPSAPSMMMAPPVQFPMPVPVAPAPAPKPVEKKAEPKKKAPNPTAVCVRKSLRVEAGYDVATCPRPLRNRRGASLKERKGPRPPPEHGPLSCAEKNLGGGRSNARSKKTPIRRSETCERYIRPRVHTFAPHHTRTCTATPTSAYT